MIALLLIISKTILCWVGVPDFSWRREETKRTELEKCYIYQIEEQFVFFSIVPGTLEYL